MLMLRSGGWWVQSQLHAVVRLLYRWRFAYVENLTWVHMGPNNRPLAEAAPHARCFHSTLLMFRKDGERRRCKFTARCLPSSHCCASWLQHPHGPSAGT
jgi:hypothetical protein